MLWSRYIWSHQEHSTTSARLNLSAIIITRNDLENVNVALENNTRSNLLKATLEADDVVGSM